MTFQNFLSRVPKWNEEIVNAEVEKIKKDSGCDYLEDLITCVHVIQLKALTCIRVGMKHKAIDIDIPKLGNFIHKIYILLARKLYTNVYLYEENIPPLDVQRNNRELEVLIRECIMEAVRDSIPVETILKAYLDETVEENVETVISTEKVAQEDNGENVSVNETTTNEETTTTNEETTTDAITTSANTNESGPTMVNVDSLISGSPTSLVEATNRDIASITAPQKQLSFSNIDEAQNSDNTLENIVAPKDFETLEKISDENHVRRMLEEAEGEDDNEDSLKISNEDANIQLDIETL